MPFILLADFLWHSVTGFIIPGAMGVGSCVGGWSEGEPLLEQGCWKPGSGIR